jgi:Kef-type K+ transport system membrane component KefB
MIPRGEVGLIFAGIGTTLFVAGERVISPPTYSAVVVMVIITTLFTPPLLKWSLMRKSSSLATAEAEEATQTGAT